MVDAPLRLPYAGHSGTDVGAKVPPAIGIGIIQKPSCTGEMNLPLLLVVGRYGNPGWVSTSCCFQFFSVSEAQVRPADRMI